MKALSTLVVLPAVLLVNQAISKLNFAVISDVHYSPYYDPDVSAATNCQSHFDYYGNQVTPDVHAPLSRIDCDPSPLLIEKFIEKVS